MREILTLDLQKSSTQFMPVIALRARRGDSRSLQRTFQIMDDGVALDLTDCTVSFMAENAGGFPIMEEVVDKGQGGQFTYRFPDAVAAVRVSRAPCAMVIIVGSKSPSPDTFCLRSSACELAARRSLFCDCA